MNKQNNCDLKEKHCQACEGGVKPMEEEQARQMLNSIPGWELNGKTIEKTFNFKNFHETVGFINVVAWIANREDHHPDLAAGYKYCKVSFSTHSIGGLSDNDFICAAKINALL